MFDKLLKEAGVTNTGKNEEKIEEIIQEYIGEQASYGRCLAEWRKARREVQGNEQMRRELIKNLRTLA